MTEQNKSEITALFAQANAELVTAEQKSTTIEIEVAQLKHLEQESDEITMLFNLADEALLDPESEKRYVQSDRRSSERQVQSQGLLRQLKKVEEAFSSPVMSLKKGLFESRQNSGEKVYGSAYVPPAVTPGAISSRIKAGIFDALYSTILALLATVAVLWFAVPEVRGVITNPNLLQPYEITIMLSVFLPLLLVCWILYPATAGARTAGQRAYKLETTDWLNREPAPGIIFLRALLLPLGVLATPFTLTRRNAPFFLHDSLTGLVSAAKKRGSNVTAKEP